MHLSASILLLLLVRSFPCSHEKSQRFEIFFHKQGEESTNPQRAIPRSICLTLLVCTVIYCAVSMVITLMVGRKFWYVNQLRVRISSRFHTMFSILMPFFLKHFDTLNYQHLNILLALEHWLVGLMIIFALWIAIVSVLFLLLRNLRFLTRFTLTLATCALCYCSWWINISFYLVDTSTFTNTNHCYYSRWHSIT